ncbi:MAG: HEAT repeat domain-containing protein [Candidatus Sumerlaeia bacterium]|nr:HEAT repeat domain-containing protein [Candidatus Sumerlaeia bacterium]
MQLRRRLAALLLAAALAAAASPAAQSTEPPRPPDRRELLTTHGVDPEAEALAAFLEAGFPPGFTVPPTPELKTQIVLSAIQEAGIGGHRALAPLLQRLAIGEPTPGVRSILERDLERQPIGMHDTVRAGFLRLVVRNATVSLGLLGDPASRPALEQVLAAADEPATRLEAAIALAMTGSGAGLSYVVEAAASDDRPLASAAFQAAYYITARNYGVTSVTSDARLDQHRGQLREWAASDAARGFAPSAPDVRRRRAAGPPAPPAPEPDTLRALLRDTRNPFDQQRRIAARNRLIELRAASLAEFRALAQDVLEDVDIRTEALRWYALVESPRELRRAARRLAKDRDAEVAQLAERLAKGE